MEDEKLGALTIKEFCSEYGLGHTKVYELINDGSLRAVKSGRRTLLLRSDIAKWEAALPRLKGAA